MNNRTIERLLALLVLLLFGIFFLVFSALIFEMFGVEVFERTSPLQAPCNTTIHITPSPPTPPEWFP